MQIHPLDLTILLAYLVVSVGIGFWISRKASKNLRTYFLGGNSIPWYFLGLSNASGMFDISGTMLMVYWLFVYGMKSVWIPWLWPVFNQIVLMIYLSLWLRRSEVLTGADWIRFRFGSGRGARLAHLIVILFALINVVGFLAYGFIGIGKFAHTFLPPEWHLSDNAAVDCNLWGLLITGLTTLYVVKGGMFSVVFTEVLQFFIMTAACLGIAIIAVQRVSPEMVHSAVPEGWHDLWFSWTLNLDWSGLLDAANGKIADDGWELFSLFIGLTLFKGVLASMAGPAPNYDMQRILSARSPKEAAMMSGIVSIALLIPRYMLITGLTVLAIAFFSDDLRSMGEEIDFELILPLAMREFVPVGLFGLLLAALLAAFMSTYAATVNAAPAYVVNDIYKRYLNPNASDQTYVRLSYATSVAVVAIGTAFGFVIDELKDVVNWIVGALYGGYIAANLLKWHWWRFNGWGYFWGMASGIVTALTIAVAFDGVKTIGGFEKNLAMFPIILGISLIGCIVGSLVTAPDDRETLKTFYLKVRPWGCWGPIRDEVIAERPQTVPNKDMGRDVLNMAVGIIWQTALTATGIYLVLKDYRSLAISVGVVCVTSLFLKLHWYDSLQDYPSDLADAPTSVSTN